MEVVVDYLQPDRSTGFLSYRRKFPKDLVRFIPSRSPTGRGRVELKVSLRTRDMNAPGAMDRYLEAEREYQAIVDRARKLSTGNFDCLDEPLVRYLADTYLHNQLALDEAGRWNRPGPEFPYPSRPDPSRCIRVADSTTF